MQGFNILIIQYKKMDLMKGVIFLMRIKRINSKLNVIGQNVKKYRTQKKNFYIS